MGRKVERGQIEKEKTPKRTNLSACQHDNLSTCQLSTYQLSTCQHVSMSAYQLANLSPGQLLQAHLGAIHSKSGPGDPNRAAKKI